MWFMGMIQGDGNRGHSDSDHTLIFFSDALVLHLNVLTCTDHDPEHITHDDGTAS
jgi:hypothetical protein